MNYVISDLKKAEETAWLREVDSILLQNATEDLSTAYRNFFDCIKGKRQGKKMQLPRFKKRSSQQSYRTRGVKIENNQVFLPKIKWINAVIHREIPLGATIKSATVSKTPSGKYFVSILVETTVELKSMSNQEVGIDLGIWDLIITSDGHKFQNPNKKLAKTKQLLKRRQKQLSRKTPGSKNYERVRCQVTKKFEKITNFKRNYYHNISHFLVSNYDAIYMEDLHVSGMLKNRCLSRAIHEVSWGILSNMIEYKCNWYGKTFYRINRWTPSSKTCNHCGYVTDKMSLNIRQWQCPKCNEIHDRDVNAALNIKHTGQIDLYGQKISSHATGERVEIPTALMKMTVKTQKSSDNSLVSHGIEQA